MEIYVAKSYQGLPIVADSYEKNKKMYCKVRLKSGAEKEVRVYSEKEYEKMYPTPAPKWKSQHDMLGFGDADANYILIFNNKPEFEEFYEKGPFRYHRVFGWYLPSSETVPVLPAGCIPCILPWEAVGQADGELKEEKQLIKDFKKFLTYGYYQEGM